MSNDVEIYGLAERASVIENIRATAENVLLLDAGDLNTGPAISMVYSAEPDILAYNMMGYDAMVLGNHEFYGGLNRLQQQKNWANFPWLCANITHKDGREFARPYIVKILPNGVRVGIVGFTTNSLLLTRPELAETFDFSCEIEVATELVPRIREKADIVIALTHIGIPDFNLLPRPYNLRNIHTSLNLAAQVPGIDLIIDGHSHTVLERPHLQNDVPVVTAGERGRFLGKAVLHFDSETKLVTLESWENIPLQRVADEKPIDLTPTGIRIRDMLDGFTGKISSTHTQVIGSIKTALNIDNIRREITPLGQFVADALLGAVGDERVNFAITNAGGIRAGLAAGNVRVLDISNILPFENHIVIVEMTGATFIEMIARSKNSRGAGAFLQYSSNISLIDGTYHLATRYHRDHDLVIEPISEHRIYRVATNSFLADGGDGYIQFKNVLSRHDTDIAERTALISWIKFKF
jgi:5'-nucleotidase/UDP-sugar diphosphatase